MLHLNPVKSLLHHELILNFLNFLNLHHITAVMKTTVPAPPPAMEMRQAVWIALWNRNATMAVPTKPMMMIANWWMSQQM